jgi:hypothetical protein
MEHDFFPFIAYEKCRICGVIRFEVKALVPPTWGLKPGERPFTSEMRVERICFTYRQEGETWTTKEPECKTYHPKTD